MPISRNNYLLNGFVEANFRQIDSNKSTARNLLSSAVQFCKNILKLCKCWIIPTIKQKDIRRQKPEAQFGPPKWVIVTQLLSPDLLLPIMELDSEKHPGFKIRYPEVACGSPYNVLASTCSPQYMVSFYIPFSLKAF